jgi:tetratricopeptide (TPR) repeat protein
MRKENFKIVLLRSICILLLTCWSMNVQSQQKQSILLNNDILVINTEGIAFLGSGITEDDAKTFAINDAKRTAMEQAGTYLESHTEVLNYTLVKDQIITYTGGLLKTNILNEKRALINNMFAFKVDIEATIDTRLLNQRIEEIRQDYSYKKLFESARERNKQLEARIAELQASIGSASQQKIRGVVNTLTASDWYDKGLGTKDANLQIEYYSEAIELDPRDYHSYNNRGLAFEELGQYEEAMKDFNKAIDLDPQEAYAYNNRGIVYRKLGQFEAAFEDYNKTIELDPQYADTYYNRGYGYERLGQNEKAIRDYTKAIELDPQNAGNYYARGNCYRKLGQYETAIQNYNKSIALDSRYASAYLNRGGSYRLLGQYETAIEDLNKAISLDSKNTYAYFNRGMAYSKLDQYEVAIKDFNKAIELDPQYTRSYYNRGFAYHNLVQLEKAIQDYTVAINLNSQYADAYYHRGLALWILLEEFEAADDFNMYLKINGNKSEDAEKVRQMIRDLGYTPEY